MTAQRVVPLALAGAIVAAVFMLVLSLLALAGVYEGAAQMMQEWHQFYDLTFVGIIVGMIEAAAITFVVFAAVAWTNNLLQRRRS